MKKKILLSIAGVFFLLLIGLPLITSQAVKFAVKKFLEDRGVTVVKVEDLWINPYTGLVSGAGVHFEKGGAPFNADLFEVKVNLWDLTKHLIHIENVQLRGIDVAVVQDADGIVTVNGISTESADEPEPEEEASSEGELWQIAISQVTLADIHTQLTTPAVGADLLLENLNLANINTRDGDSGQITGQLKLQSLTLPDAGLEMRVGLSLTSETRVSQSEEAWTLAGDTTIGLEDLWVNVPDYQIQLQQLSLFTKKDLVFGHEWIEQLTADLALTQFSVHSDVGAVLASFDELDVKGIHPDGLSVANAVSIDSISLNGVNALPSSTEALPGLLQDARLDIEKIQVNVPTEDQALAAIIESIRIPWAKIEFIRDRDGNTPQLAALASGEEPAPEAAQEVPAEQVDAPESTPESPAPVTSAGENVAGTTDMPDVTIGRFAIGPEVSLGFADQSVSPELVETLAFREFEITDLRLNKDQPANLHADIGLKDDAGLAIDGQFTALTQAADLTLKLDDFQVLRASGFSQSTIGYALEAGTLDVDSKIKVEDQILNLTNDIFIDQLSLRPTNENKTVKFANELTMPLDQALDLIRDKENQIRLQVPVNGPLNDPNVNLSQVINKALGGAMKKATVSMLGYLLQPYSTMISVAKFAGDQMTKVRLDPVVFNDGDAQLNTDAREYGEKIADMLKSKESLKLRVCGSTNLADAAAVKAQWDAEQQQKQQAASKEAKDGDTEQKSAPVDQPVLSDAELSKRLQSLGETRSSVFRSYLIDQLQMNKAQLMVCLPEHHDSDKAPSGVQLEI